jgi:hypothetical protein
MVKRASLVDIEQYRNDPSISWSNLRECARLGYLSNNRQEQVDNDLVRSYLLNESLASHLFTGYSGSTPSPELQVVLMAALEKCLSAGKSGIADISSAKSEILESAANYAPRTGVEKKWAAITSRASDWWTQIVMNWGKQTVPEYEITLARTIADRAEQHPDSGKIFAFEPYVEKRFQIPIYAEQSGLAVKAMPDIVTIQHTNKCVVLTTVSVIWDTGVDLIAEEVRSKHLLWRSVFETVVMKASFDTLGITYPITANILFLQRDLRQGVPFTPKLITVPDAVWADIYVHGKNGLPAMKDCFTLPHPAFNMDSAQTELVLR